MSIFLNTFLSCIALTKNNNLKEQKNHAIGFMPESKVDFILKNQSYNSS